MTKRVTRKEGRRHAMSAICSVLLVSSLVFATAASGQTPSKGQAVITIPPVSELQVEWEPRSPQPESGFEGTARVRVRANHNWQLRLSARVVGSVRVRTDDSATEGEYHRLEPNVACPVAEGGPGEVVVEVRLRLEERYSELPGDDPLQFTLAAP